MCLGVPGRVAAVADEARRLVWVDFAGVRRTVSLACVAAEDEALDDWVGRWVLVHVGFALAVVDEAEARETLRLMAALKGGSTEGTT